MNQPPARERAVEAAQRGKALEEEQKLAEAREAFDVALSLDPQSQPAAEGRARVALALGEADAAEPCARALRFHDESPERQILMIRTAAVELGNAAIPLVQDHLNRNPSDPAAHETLAELLAEQGDQDFTATFRHALSREPTNKPLWMSYWNTLTRAGALDLVLQSIDEQRSRMGHDRDVAMLEVMVASHAGQPDRAGKLLDQLDNRPDAQLARGQHRLQTGQPQEAVAFLQEVLAADPNNLTAWALIEIAWRLVGSPHHEWLVRGERLIGAVRLDLSTTELSQIADALRLLHRTRAQPLGQSVRGGTQTAGQLFVRNDPEIVALTGALTQAIRRFVAALPPRDPHHPLLKYRDMGLAFGPSWSVRLADGGHHAPHFHPNGALSSACYLALPDGVEGASDQTGWLEIGRPPPELGLDLRPLTTIEPKEGQLVLFPSFLFHGTRPFAAGERLTVAFDLVPVPMD